MRALTTALLLLSPACDGKLFSIRLSETSSTTVSKGTVVEALLGDLGFDDFVSMNLLNSTELQNQGVEPGDVVDVRMLSLELEAMEPDGADLSFLNALSFDVSAPGVDRARLASQDAFPAGQPLVAMDVEDLDLTAYVVSESMTLSADVDGSRPEQDTRVEARFVLRVGVTGQGVANAARR